MDPILRSHSLSGLTGTCDERAREPIGALYLLDRDFRVLSQYAQDAPIPHGASFFDVCPVDPSERFQLEKHLDGFDRKSLLCCAKKPVVFVCEMYHVTGLLLAVVPTGEVSRILQHPGLFSGQLTRLVFTTLSAQRKAPLTAQEFDLVRRWYAQISRTFAPYEDKESLLPFLSTVTRQLARLCGVRVHFDLYGLYQSFEIRIDTAMFGGVVLAALMAAGRMATNREIDLIGTYTGEEGAILFASFVCEDGERVLDELSPIARRAEQTGALLLVYRDPHQTHRVNLYAALTIPEISIQGVKQRQIRLSFDDVAKKRSAEDGEIEFLLI